MFFSVAPREAHVEPAEMGWGSACLFGKPPQWPSSPSGASSVRFVQPYSRFLRPVALVVDGCGHADHNGGEEVTRHVVVLLPGVFALKDLDQHEVQLDPLETHPGEGSQEEEVEDPGDDGTPNLGFRCRREEK